MRDVVQGGGVVLVVAVDVPGEARTWTVLGADHLPVAVVEEFLEYQRADGASPHTVRAYAQGLRLFWEFLELVGVGWGGVGAELFAEFRRWLATGLAPGVSALRPPEPLRSTSTVETRSAAVLSFYRFQFDMHDEPAVLRLYRPVARRGRGGYQDALAHLQRHRGPQLRPVFRSRRPAPRRTPVFTPEQVQALLDGCASVHDGVWRGSVRDRLLFATLYETGMRLGECLSLQHQDWVVSAGRTPYIEVVPRATHPWNARVKSGEPRRIYISHELEDLYAEYLWQLCERGAAEARDPLDQWWVFVNLDRGEPFAPIRPETVYHKVRGLKARLGAALPEGWTPHWFRHSHASTLLLAGVPEHVVMRRLGHRDVQTTLSRYGWVTEDAQLRALADWQQFVAANPALARTEQDAR